MSMRYHVPGNRMTSAIALLAGSLLAACGGDAAPATSGRFDMVQTQAGTLPVPLGEMDGCRHEAVGGDVELRDTLFVATLRRRRLCPDSASVDSVPLPPDTILNDSARGTYQMEGDSIFFRLENGGFGGYGVLAHDTLVVVGPLHTFYYLRKEGG